MKAGDVSGGHTSSRESWLSTPLSDPNAALWASITPPANPNLATIVRRGAAAFSLERLAQRVYLRFPARFSSRSTARSAILAGLIAVGAALGTVGYLSVDAEHPHAAAPVPTSPARAAAIVQHRASDTTTAKAAARRGETHLAAPERAPATTLATTAPSTTPEQRVQPLLPSADAVASSPAAAKAKRGTAKKRSKVIARRASKRRVRATAD